MRPRKATSQSPRSNPLTPSQSRIQEEDRSLESLETRYVKTELDLMQLEQQYHHRKVHRTNSPAVPRPDLRGTGEAQEALLELCITVGCDPPSWSEVALIEQIPGVLKRVKTKVEEMLRKYRTEAETGYKREVDLKERERDVLNRLQVLETRETACATAAKSTAEEEMRLLALKDSMLEQQNKLQEEHARFKKAVKTFEAAQTEFARKESIFGQKQERISHEEQRIREETDALKAKNRALEELKADIERDQRKTLEDKEKVGKQLGEIDLKARELKQGIEAFIKERQSQTMVYKKRKSALKDAFSKLKSKEEALKQRESESADLMKDIQKEHERLQKETEERIQFFKAMEETLATKELEINEERQDLEELTKDLAGVKRDLEMQQDELMHQLTARQSSIEHQEHIFELHSKELETQTKSLDDEMAVVHEIKTEVERNQRELDEVRRSWMNKAAVKDAELNSLRTELESAKKRLEQEEKRLNEAKTAIDEEGKKHDRVEAAEIAELKGQVEKFKTMMKEKDELVEHMQSLELKTRAETAKKDADVAQRETNVRRKEEEVAQTLLEIEEKERRLATKATDLYREEAKLADQDVQNVNLTQAKADFERYKSEIMREIEAELGLVRREKEELESTALVLEKVHEDLNRARLKNERDSQLIQSDFQKIQELQSQLPYSVSIGSSDSHRYQEELAERKLMEMDRSDDKIKIEAGDSLESLSLLSLSTPRGSIESSLRRSNVDVQEHF